MSTTTDAITAAVLIGPGALLGAAALITQRGAKADSAAVLQVLAESAAERAARTAETDMAPPDGGEGAPAPVAETPARLATVLAFPEGRVRRAA
ncbi:hypothetical protein BX285_2565 [Streptomyces sp. 1114.5]|uniref:hypothetical protein n=1 Tax=Streptomyces sp. 1114.5 TaxID=1938830 RepID=UPI000EAE6617|nr:hypothetical protein [Streptomyces sp. 1114.5]RKT18148.1 hypothetical protein BX285_2565 [Streptomyces sp. 1114.5]